MKTEFTLGRSPINDIVVEEPVVGRNHLLIQFKSENELIIEDLDTNNATFVNKIRIKKKSVTREDQILLGGYELNSKFLFTEIIKKVNHSRTDFTKEFFELKNIYEEYEKKVNEIKNKSQVFPFLIRAFITLCAMAAAFFIFSNPQIRYPVMTGAGVLGGFVSLLFHKDSKLKDQIDILTAELEMVYKCPKCSKSLISRRWKHWAIKKECENCGAKWIN
jgi:pSer/pThr/pTyr-binding forkhead associated (FHA) protein/DNA-directed RNA polymerase subunit RPC12/RpoP